MHYTLNLFGKQIYFLFKLPFATYRLAPSCFLSLSFSSRKNSISVFAGMNLISISPPIAFAILSDKFFYVHFVIVSIALLAIGKTPALFPVEVPANAAY